MNFINRAFKNVTRKLSKTILLILTFCLIGNFVIIGLSVAQASESAKTLTRQKMRAVVTYEVDFQKWYAAGDAIEDEEERNKFFQKFPGITYNDVSEIIKDPRVKTANVNTTQMMYNLDGTLDYVHLGNKYEENNSEGFGGGQSCWIDESGEEVCETYVQPQFLVKANYFPNMIEFADNMYSMVEGEFYNQQQIDDAETVCLITEALAEHNGLRVGDTIKLSVESLSGNMKKAGISEDDITADFKIIGIFNHNSPLTPDNPNYDYASPYENPDNMILMPGTTYSKIRVASSQMMFDYYASISSDDEYYSNPENRPTYEKLNDTSLFDVTFLLNDPLEVDTFVEEYSTKVGEYKQLDPNNEEFQRLSKPLDTLSAYANFIIILVVVNAVVIITLITALTLKTREYEIGVLLSIGATKLKVVMQFFLELALVALVGFTLAVGTGSIISKQIGYKLLENQIQTSGVNENKNENYGYYNQLDIWSNDYTTEVSMEDIISEYDVSVSPIIILEIYVLGLAIVFVSVIIPSIMIMRFNPKKILMNQN